MCRVQSQSIWCSYSQLWVYGKASGYPLYGRLYRTSDEMRLEHLISSDIKSW